MAPKLKQTLHNAYCSQEIVNISFNVGGKQTCGHCCKTMGEECFQSQIRCVQLGRHVHTDFIQELDTLHLLPHLGVSGQLMAARARTRRSRAHTFNFSW